jgi:chitin disaccharide deacetylase
MPPRLILNADDFGLTPGINRAIAELHAAGGLTSATLMAAGPAFDDAIAIARAHPTLGVGCHIVLTDGTPISPPETIPTLLGPDRKNFRPSLTHFIQDLLLDRIDEDEIEREALAQIQKLQRAGIDVTHLDTHKHTHIFPPVARALVRITRHTSVATLRNPFEPPFAREASNTTLKRRLQIWLLDHFQPSFNRIAGQQVFTDGTIGISATGNLNADTLKATLDTLPTDGTFELLCHPGYNDAALDAITTRLRAHREVEYQALLDQIPKLSLRPNRPDLIHYGNLGAFGALRAEGLFIPGDGTEIH